MKSIKKEIAVFILTVVFLVAGAASLPFAKLFAGSAKRFVTGQTGFSETVENVNSEIDKRLAYHGFLMDLNSLVLRLTGTEYVRKDDSVVSIAENGMLSDRTTKQLSEKQARAASEKVSALRDVAEKNGAGFLYVFAPAKNLFLDFPAGIDNYSLENKALYLDSLKEKKIDLLDLSDGDLSGSIRSADDYFITDHHWKPEAGFRAARLILEKLGGEYGLSYDEKISDLNNYNVKGYEKWFLGSAGKKVGRFFSPLGLDDVSLITPKFKTSLVERQPAKNEKKSGSFEETVIDKSFIEKKDLYGLNPYAAYSGGDFRLQITENKLSANEKKILVVRDSYACAVTPFLALGCRELHVADVRDFEYFVGDKLNLEKYIEKIRPDVVLVLYNGTPTVKGSNGSFDFF